MRSVLWILILLTLCATLWAWNVRVTTRARAERAELRQGRSPSSDLPAGWDHAVIGEASGAPLVEPPSPSRATQKAPGGTHRSELPSSKGVPPQPPTGPETQAVQHVVAAGESLSTICQARYGTARPDLVAAVARANHLDQPGQIKTGATIVLPALAELHLERR